MTTMYEFLSQFKLLENFGVENRFLENEELLPEAKKLGYVKNWKPPKGCSYRPAIICTLKGRLFLKRGK